MILIFTTCYGCRLGVYLILVSDATSTATVTPYRPFMARYHGKVTIENSYEPKLHTAHCPNVQILNNSITHLVLLMASIMDSRLH